MDISYLMNAKTYNKLIKSRNSGKKLHIKSYDLFKSNDRSHTIVIKFNLISEEFGDVGEFICENSKTANIALNFAINAQNDKEDSTDYVTVLVVAARYLAEKRKIWLSKSISDKNVIDDDIKINSLKLENS